MYSSTTLRKPAWVSWSSRLAPLLALVVLALALGTTEYRPPERIHAALREWATHNPEARVAVIVQKLASDNAVEARAAELGGTITKDLHIINAFAAELPAAQAVALAAEPGVRWVSLDAPVQSADTNDSTRKFIAWATRLGTKASNTFVDAEKMLSPVGHNGTYGYGSNAQTAPTATAATPRSPSPGSPLRSRPARRSARWKPCSRPTCRRSCNPLPTPS